MRKIVFFAFMFLAVLACKSDQENQDEEKYFVPRDPSTISSRSSSAAAEAAEAETMVGEPGSIEASVASGAKIFNNLCATCHMASGEGVPNAFPPLNKSNWLTEKRKAAIHAVKYGLTGPITVNGKEFNSVMAPMGLNDQEVADVLNYVFQAWDNNVSPPVTKEEVAAVTK
ncbi:MAG TPA: cytochrome c [Salinimicrobium sp.]|nr:cytochrome c [Salinimicrobium sp.]